MLACVTFNVGMRGFEYVERCGCEDCVEEEGDIPLRPSSASVVIVCVMKLTFAMVSSSSRMGVAEAVRTSSSVCSG